MNGIAIWSFIVDINIFVPVLYILSIQMESCSIIVYLYFLLMQNAGHFTQHTLYKSCCDMIHSTSKRWRLQVGVIVFNISTKSYGNGFKKYNKIDRAKNIASKMKHIFEERKKMKPNGIKYDSCNFRLEIWEWPVGQWLIWTVNDCRTHHYHEPNATQL